MSLILNAESWCSTQGKIVPITFKWTLTNFSFHLKGRVGYLVKSTSFSSASANEIKWHLTVYPKGSSLEHKDYLSLYLFAELGEKPETTLTLAYQLWILNSKCEKSQFGNQSAICEFNKTIAAGGWHKFVALNILQDKTKDLLPNDTLTVYCQIDLLTESRSESGTVSTAVIPENRLEEDLFNLLEKGLFSDLTLVVDGHEFKVHRNILAARSPVFTAMFLSEMKEKNQDVIKIQDVSKDAMNDMLYFIYTGKAPQESSVKVKRDLLAAAEEFDLERLKVICENVLSLQINVDNVVDLLISADLHRADKLKTTAMDFVTTHVNLVKKTENWMKLVHSHPCLLNDVYEYHLQHGLKKGE